MISSVHRLPMCIIYSNSYNDDMGLSIITVPTYKKKMDPDSDESFQVKALLSRMQSKLQGMKPIEVRPALSLKPIAPAWGPLPTLDPRLLQQGM